MTTARAALRIPQAFTTMSFRNLLRTPWSIGLALGAIGAAFYKRTKSSAKPDAAAKGTSHAVDDPAKRIAELTRLTHYLLVASEDEKSRIARELHDGLGSTLTAVNLDLFWVQQRLADQPQLAGRLARAIEVLAATVEIKRRIIHELRPAALDNLGLTLAIESNVAEFEKTSELPVHIDLAEIPPLTEHASIALFRIYQDALAAAARRPGVTRIGVSMHEEAGGVYLEISDDGIADERTAAVDDQAAFTLLTMRERAAALGGEITVEHADDRRRTTLRVFVPKPFREPSEAALAEP